MPGYDDLKRSYKSKAEANERDRRAYKPLPDLPMDVETAAPREVEIEPIGRASVVDDPLADAPVPAPAATPEAAEKVVEAVADTRSTPAPAPATEEIDPFVTGGPRARSTKSGISFDALSKMPEGVLDNLKRAGLVTDDEIAQVSKDS